MIYKKGSPVTERGDTQYLGALQARPTGIHVVPQAIGILR